MEENAVCQNYIENIAYVKNRWKLAKMANFLGKIKIFVIDLPVSMGNVDLEKLFDIDFRFILANIGLIWKKLKRIILLGVACIKKYTLKWPACICIRAHSAERVNDGLWLFSCSHSVL